MIVQRISFSVCCFFNPFISNYNLSFPSLMQLSHLPLGSVNRKESKRVREEFGRNKAL